MKAFVLVPSRLHPKRLISLRDTGTDECSGFQCWYEMLRDKLGFEILYTDKASDLPSDTDIVWCVFRNQSFSDLGRLQKGIKLISHLGDIHGCHKEWLLSHPEALDRSDVIIGGVNSRFGEIWPQYLHKYVFWPQFFRPHEAYADLKFNESPIMKCIMPGRVGSPYYRLRTEISMKVACGGRWREIIDTVKHYWYDRNRTTVHEWERAPVCGAKYAKLLNEYFCGFSTVSAARYLLAKCVEIPAAGALLITQETQDMGAANFVPWKHYVPVKYDKESIFTQITECLTHPDKYQGIRRKGMEFVRANHSIRTRLQQFKKILQDV